MAAFATFSNPKCRCGGLIRVGPEAKAWLDPWVWLLGFHVEDGNIGVIDGLDRRVTRDDYRDIIGAIVAEGLRPAYDRVKPGRKKYRVWCAIPAPRP